jgi:hypothetical protein
MFSGLADPPGSFSNNAESDKDSGENVGRGRFSTSGQSERIKATAR